ncbi:trypsin-like serine peptidase [Streptomyces avermitilis]|uniref:trypsin-like serine peptidase n=1 Tax=Streptomyces avermitilis TaxID=33903 RepID=UPI0036BD8F75
MRTHGVEHPPRGLVHCAGTACARLGSSPANTYSDIVFVPGYAKDKAPYGRYAVKATMTPCSWAEDTVKDIAAMVVATPAKGKRLTDAVGAQNIAFSRPAGERVTAFGCPATTPQRGEELLYCPGNSQRAPEGEEHVPCDLGGSASGGPWLAGFNSPTGKGTVVSVNSHGEGDGGTPMYGPTLDKTAGRLQRRPARLSAEASAGRSSGPLDPGGGHDDFAAQRVRGGSFGRGAGRRGYVRRPSCVPR